MMSEAAARERRRSYRIDVLGRQAMCWGEGFAGAYSIENLSSTGALLSGRPIPPIGEPLEMSMRAPGRGPFRVNATVVRHASTASEGGELGVIFDDMPDHAAELLQATMIADMIDLAEPRVLVVGASPCRSAALRDHLKSLGFPSAGIVDPTEARIYLTVHESHVGLVILDAEHLGALQTASFIRFAVHLGPGTRIVTTQPRADTDEHARCPSGVLLTPWTFDDLCDLVLGQA